MASGLFDSLGTSFGPVATYALAAIVVFVLLLVVLALAKRTLRSGAANPGLRRGPRLAIIDVAAVDQRRKLVLLRRDDVEHLILIGGQNDLVVEEGILRTPSAVQPSSPDRPGISRPEMAAAAPMGGRPSVVAPDPRVHLGDGDTSRAASPLRRPLPQPQPTQRPAVPPAGGRGESAVAVEPQRPAEPAPPIVRPAPLLEPAIVAEAPEPPRQSVPPAPKAAAQEPQRSVPPVEMPEIFMPDRTSPTEVSEPSPPRERPESAPAAKGMAVPAFLQRGDTPPESGEEAPKPAAAPAPVVAAAPVVQPPAPPQQAAGPRIAGFERAPARPESVPVPVAVSRNERPPVSEPPLFPRAPAFVGAPAVKPDEPFPPAVVPPAVGEPTTPQRAERRPDDAPAAPEIEAPVVEPMEDADRRPLSVRSFASAIQSRRSAAEPTAQPRPAPSPERPRTTVTPTFPAREAPTAAPASPVRAPASDDGGLEEALSRELDSGLGSLDWNDEPRATAPDKPTTLVADKPAIVTPPSPPSPPVAEQKAERRPTLEEEMERLLSDFDFGPPRR